MRGVGQIVEHQTYGQAYGPWFRAGGIVETGSQIEAWTNLITCVKLEIEKLRRELFGTCSERKDRFLDHVEMQLEALEARATKDELAAEAVSRIDAFFDIECVINGMAAEQVLAVRRDCSSDR